MVDVTRRMAALAALAAPGLIGRAQAAPRVLRIAHQFPASSGKTGDFCDRMCRRFAELVGQRMNGRTRCWPWARG